VNPCKSAASSSGKSIVTTAGSAQGCRKTPVSLFSDIEKAPCGSLFLSGSVSRILSRTTICLTRPKPRGAAGAALRPTWTYPGRVIGPAWPCTWRGLPGRRVTATPVRSYRTISPLPVRDSRVAAPSAVYFCGTFPRVSPGGRYPPPSPLVSGLSSRGFLSPRGRSTRPLMVLRHPYSAATFPRYAGISRSGS
jgi:hypothetical protein